MNAADNKSRDPSMNLLKIDIDVEQNRCVGFACCADLFFRAPTPDRKSL